MFGIIIEIPYLQLLWGNNCQFKQNNENLFLHQTNLKKSQNKKSKFQVELKTQLISNQLKTQLTIRIERLDWFFSLVKFIKSWVFFSLFLYLYGIVSIIT